MSAARGQMVPIEFHGDMLWAMQCDGPVWVAIKTIADALGLRWENQLRRIKRDTILSEGMAIMAIPSPGGVQETVCLPLELVPGWLFGIDDRRVKPEARDKVLAYKRECHAVLFAHFFGKATEAVRGYDLDRIEAHLPQHQMRVLAAARALAGTPASWDDIATIAGLSPASVRRAAELLDALELIRLHRNVLDP